jgi:bifunctional UDP-N-acetylglucosamine pyrophosphorylase/glucosamine-1-phosphate N-acetyltransferase
MCGDSPLFQPETIHLLTEKHLQEKATLTLTSAIVHNPTGYGRILRNDKGEIEGIVEEKVASDKEKEIREVNGGCYAFNAIWLWKNINLMHKNEVGEYCLTEMVDIAVAQQQKVCAISANADEIVGINTFQDLQAAEAILQARGKHT